MNLLKKIIKETLHRLIEEKGYKIIPQDYSKEYRQTGSGKSIFGKKNVIRATTEEINRAAFRIKEAKEIVRIYKNAFINGIPDLNGVIKFNVTFQNKQYECKIPPQFKNRNSIGGNKVDYLYYFDDPNAGDGAVETVLDKRGYLNVKQIRSKPDIEQNPDLSSATDAGYEKEYQGMLKYFKVKVGVLGKFSEKNYSVFPTPAIDASVKTNFIFASEILQFMKGSSLGTSDDNATKFSNNMDVDKKIEKIRKDAENYIGKPISSNKEWIEFKTYLIKAYGKPDSPFTLNADKELENFISKYKVKNVFKPIGKPEIGLPKDEKDAYEKRNQEKLARIAAARARMNKKRS
jgi:hypothetical protein